MYKLFLKKLYILFDYLFSGYAFYPELYIQKKYKSPDLNSLKSNYLSNLDLITTISKQKKAKVSFFLQPYNGSGIRSMTYFDVNSNKHICRRVYPDGSNQYDINEDFYRLVKSEIKRKENFHDLTNIFDQYNYNEEIWFDQVHFSDIGADIIAKEIVKTHFQYKLK